MENCRFFKESSEEEREHAEKLMKYQVGVVLCSSTCLAPLQQTIKPFYVFSIKDHCVWLNWI